MALQNPYTVDTGHNYGNNAYHEEEFNPYAGQHQAGPVAGGGGYRDEYDAGYSGYRDEAFVPPTQAPVVTEKSPYTHQRGASYQSTGPPK